MSDLYPDPIDGLDVEPDPDDLDYWDDLDDPIPYREADELHDAACFAEDDQAAAEAYASLPIWRRWLYDWRERRWERKFTKHFGRAPGDDAPIQPDRTVLRGTDMTEQAPPDPIANLRAFQRSVHETTQRAASGPEADPGSTDRGTPVSGPQGAAQASELTPAEQAAARADALDMAAAAWRLTRGDAPSGLDDSTDAWLQRRAAAIRSGALDDEQAEIDRLRAESTRLAARVDQIEHGLQGTCPSCRHQSLTVDDRGWLTCHWSTCEHPDAAALLLIDPPTDTESETTR